MATSATLISMTIHTEFLHFACFEDCNPNICTVALHTAALKVACLEGLIGIVEE